MSANPVCWWELASHDAEASVTFLRKVFDWEIAYDAGLGLYDIPVVDGGRSFLGGGVFTLRKAKLPFLTLYIRVEDIEDKMRLVEECGGHIVEGPTDLPTGSRICLFNESSGVTLAMLQPAPHRDG